MDAARIPFTPTAETSASRDEEVLLPSSAPLIEVDDEQTAGESVATLYELLSHCQQLVADRGCTHIAGRDPDSQEVTRLGFTNEGKALLAAVGHGLFTCSVWDLRSGKALIRLEASAYQRAATDTDELCLEALWLVHSVLDETTDQLHGRDGSFSFRFAA